MSLWKVSGWVDWTMSEGWASTLSMCIQYFAVLDSYGCVGRPRSRGARRSIRISHVVPVRPRQVTVIGRQGGSKPVRSGSWRTRSDAIGTRMPSSSTAIRRSSNSGVSPTTPTIAWKCSRCRRDASG